MTRSQSGSGQRSTRHMPTGSSPGSATTHPTRSWASTWSRPTATAWSSARSTPSWGHAPPNGSRRGGAPRAPRGARAGERGAAGGHVARPRSDISAAANLFGRAADLIPEGPQRPELLVRLGEALHPAGEIERARSVLEEARSLAAAAGNAHVEWLARIQLAFGLIDTEPEGAAEEAF